MNVLNRAVYPYIYLYDITQAIGVKDNRYTPFVIGDMHHTRDNVLNALQKRKEAYAKELERQEIMEAKRKEFAAAVDDFLAWLAKERDVCIPSSYNSIKC